MNFEQQFLGITGMVLIFCVLKTTKRSRVQIFVFQLHFFFLQRLLTDRQISWHPPIGHIFRLKSGHVLYSYALLPILMIYQRCLDTPIQ